MSKLLGELLFGLARSLVAGWLNGLSWRLFEKVGAWLDTKISERRIRIVLGLLLGFAAYAFLPIVAMLLK